MGHLYRLGKLDARPEAIPLKMSDIVDLKALAAPPAQFGHERLVANWQMLENDRIGDCAIAGPLHSVLMWNSEANKSVTLNDAAAVANYTAITGYEPGPELVVSPQELADLQPNPTDQGTDVPSMVKYWLTDGFVDGTGLRLDVSGEQPQVVQTGTPGRHKIGAAVALEPGNWEQLVYACYYFDGVGLGIQCCEEWQEAFANGGIFDAVRNPNIEGGHYICGAAVRNNNVVVVTWGGTIQMTQAGYEQFSDETVAYASQEKLDNGVDLEGFSWSQLRSDLPKLDRISTLADAA